MNFMVEFQLSDTVRLEQSNLPYIENIGDFKYFIFTGITNNYAEYSRIDWMEHNN